MRKKLWNKRQDKRGFTLVELIVVLIILAILAALLIPALTGYIDKAKEKQIIAETRQAVMAAQTLGDEVYAKGSKPIFKQNKPSTPDATKVYASDVKDLADVPGTVEAVEYNDDGSIKSLQYKDKSQKKIGTYTWDGSADTGTYTVNPS